MERDRQSHAHGSVNTCACVCVRALQGDRPQVVHKNVDDHVWVDSLTEKSLMNVCGQQIPPHVFNTLCSRDVLTEREGDVTKGRKGALLGAEWVVPLDEDTHTHVVLRPSHATCTTPCGALSARFHRE